MGVMEQQLWGCRFKNPVIAASGTFGFGEEYQNFYDISILGGISTKGMTLEPRDGNSGLRIIETPSGVMNSIGLQNPGVLHYTQCESRFLAEKNIVILANVGGSTLESYLEALSILEAENKKKRVMDMVELNISCPNVKAGGMAFGMNACDAELITKKAREVITVPLIVKLSPNAHHLVEVAQAVESAGADGISLVNTFNALEIDIYRRKALFDNITAGLSGPCIRPIALRMVREVSKAVSIPVIGMGGVQTWQDVVKFIMAGAHLVQFGTGSFMDPMMGKKLVEGLENYVREQGIRNWKEIRGII